LKGTGHDVDLVGGLGDLARQLADLSDAVWRQAVMTRVRNFVHEAKIIEGLADNIVKRADNIVKRVLSAGRTLSEFKELSSDKQFKRLCRDNFLTLEDANKLMLLSTQSTISTKDREAILDLVLKQIERGYTP
jgi:hypothetical protein